MPIKRFRIPQHPTIPLRTRRQCAGAQDRETTGVSAQKTQLLYGFSHVEIKMPGAFVDGVVDGDYV